MKDKKTKIAALGYPRLESVKSHKSVAHLFRSSKDRCGIYLLEFPNSVYYIGQAVDVVRRFRQHRTNHNDIIGFSFIRFPRHRLNEMERQLIFEAENLGFLLSNSVHATNITGYTDFDSVVSPGWQELWREFPEIENEYNDYSTIDFTDSFAYRSKEKYNLFKELPDSDVALSLLRAYVNCCIPLPKRTEYSFWSLSCMPSTRRRLGQALAVINISCMETFVIGRLEGSDNKLYGYINLASDILKQNRQWRMKIEGWDVLSFSEILGYRYKHASQHQLTVVAYGADNIVKLLNDSLVKEASAELNLRLMRKRACLNQNSHCIDLARQIVMEEPTLYRLYSPAPSTSNTLAR